MQRASRLERSGYHVFVTCILTLSSSTQYHKRSYRLLPFLLWSELVVEHPCNMKEFKLFVGTNSDSLKEVIHSGLKNDAVPETFSLRHTNTVGVSFPVRFVKIVPLS